MYDLKVEWLFSFFYAFLKIWFLQRENTEFTLGKIKQMQAKSMLWKSKCSYIGLYI